MHKIAVIPGDGIGIEVTNEALKALNVIGEEKGIDLHFDLFPWGCDFYLKNGRMMPENGMEILKSYEAIFLGAVGDPSVEDSISLRELLIKIRQGFNQYINLRPIKRLEGVDSILTNNQAVDFLVIRENSEGEYAGLGELINEGKEDETALQTAVFSRKGVERVIRYAFELASKEKKKLTSVSKANALNYSMVFWDKIFNEVKNEYPDVQTETLLVDAAAMFFVKSPDRFDVIVTTNLFGDILTDLGAALAGGMGLAAGANINPERQYPSMFEPIHGSAPDIAGKGIANPFASIWAASQLVDFLGYKEYADIMLNAISQQIKAAQVLPVDLGGNSKTVEVGNEYCRILRECLKDVA